MVWGRAGWAGSQRYPIQWGGEPQSDWEGLAASIRGGLSWGMSGVPYHSSDIGGFYGAQPPAAELYVRWLQAAVFGSHLRVQGIGEREPWAFGAEAEAIARKWLAFRYRLIPYLQRAVAAAVATGMPVMRAMALAFPGNALTRGHDTQFMCGDALLVAPIVRGRRGRDRAAAGGVVRPQFPPALSRSARTPLQGGARPVPGVRPRGPCAAAGPRGPAHRRDRPAKPLEQLWVFGPPTQPLAGLAQATVEAARRDVRDPRGFRGQGGDLRRRPHRRRRHRGGSLNGPRSRSRPANRPASVPSSPRCSRRATASTRLPRASSSSATATCSRRARRGSAPRRGMPITTWRRSPRRRGSSKSGISRWPHR